MKLASAVLVASSFAASAACGGNLNRQGGGTAGTAEGGAVGTGGSQGGTTGTGGTTAVGGTGGSSTIDGGPVQEPPSCLVDLLATCPLTGSCQYNSSDGGLGEKWCFDSGLTVSLTASGRCGMADVVKTVQEVRRADGTLCYSIEDTRLGGHGCEGDDYVWKDSAGTVIASGNCDTTDNGGIAVCASTGEQGWCGSGAVRFPLSGSVCTQGTCP